MKIKAILLTSITLMANINAFEAGKAKLLSYLPSFNRESLKDLAVNSAYAVSKGIENLKQVDFLKQNLERYGHNFAQAISGFKYRNQASSAAMVSGLLLMQYAMYKKAKFNGEDLFWKLMRDKVSRRMVLTKYGYQDFLTVKLVFDIRDEVAALAEAIKADESNNKKSLMLALSGLALTASGYLYHK